MLVYKVKLFDSTLKSKKQTNVADDIKLIDLLIKIKSCQLYLKLHPELLRQFKLDKSCEIKKDLFDKIVNENKLSNDEKTRISSYDEDPSEINLYLETFCSILSNCVKQFAFQKIPILGDTTYFLKLLEFIAKRDFMYFLDMKQIYTGINQECEAEDSKYCIRYHVSISDNYDKDEYYLEVISMIVKVNEESKNQIHMHIHKNIQNTLYQYFKGVKIPSLAILLHSFASDYFKSDTWFTCPLGSMSKILDKQKIPYKTISTDKPLINEYQWVNNAYVCGINMGSCPGNLIYFIKTVDMSGIWKKSVIVTNIDKYTYVTNKKTWFDVTDFKLYDNDADNRIECKKMII